ncbi:MAG TPA: hypothetical protein VLD58_08315 [Gemmatimonadales bacterium]|nr:hypothetical protein [Gemmatimonadales bacterium]
MPLPSRLAAALALVALPVAELPAQSFAGRVLIEDRPADPGTYVQVVVYRADRSFTVCGDTTVGTGGRYQLVVYPKPDCRTPGDRYEFYVNGVWAASRSAASTTPGGPPVPTDMTAPMLALRTSNRPGVRLVWFYGTVTDPRSRPAPVGIRIVASPDTSVSAGNSCLGTGLTQDLFWTPKTPGAQPLNVKGFYVIGIEMAAECQDMVTLFQLRGAGGSPGTVTPQTVLVDTPPYGLPSRKNLVLRANPD